MGIWSMTTRVTLLGTSTSLPPWSMTVWVPVSSEEAAEETAEDGKERKFFKKKKIKKVEFCALAKHSSLTADTAIVIL